MQVVSAALARLAVGVEAGRGKHPLPGPFAAGVSIFLGEGAREGNVACAMTEV